jgi:formylglycine-generating enzyme required for sulfatase activity
MRSFHEEGLYMWYDDGIPPAEEWQNEIAQKIMEAAMLVVFLSPNAVSSSYVNREIQFALSENKPILPIFLEETSLTPSLKLCLHQYQSCFCQKLDWQKRAIEVMRKVLAKANDPAETLKKVRTESVEEEIFDESEGLWKVMDQIFTTQLNRQTRLFGPKKSPVTTAEIEKDISIRPSILSPQKEKSSSTVNQTRHPFAVDVSVNDGAKESSKENKPPHKNAYIGNLSWIPPGKITIKVPYTSGRRAVSVPHGFWLSQLVVTQEFYTDVMGVNPSYVDTESGAEVVNLPVNRVSWLDAVEFCKALTVLSGLNGNMPENHEFRLPTEVEWEYACRAGATTDYYFGDDPAELHEHAWYLVNSVRRVHPVKLKEANPWGLYDMYGNVWEWVGNSFVNTLLEDSEQDEFRICRGGTYMKNAAGCKSSSRDTKSLFHRYRNLGFRVALARLPNS